MQPNSPATTLSPDSTTPPGKAALWGGRVLSGAVVAMLVMSAVMKLTGGDELIKGLAHLGFMADIVPTLAVLELSCVVLYLIPHTAVLGAILMTGYLGGAISAHLRVGDPVTVPVILGVVTWLALYLREPRLRRVLPLRSI